MQAQRLLQHPEAVTVREHQVEDEEIPLLRRQAGDRDITVAGHGRVVPLGLKASGDEAGDQRLVLGKEDSHPA